MRRRYALFLFLFGLFTIVMPTPGADQFKFPLNPNSVRFAAIGDMGTGEPAQYEIAQDMVKARQFFAFDFVIMLGDNIYGGSAPADFEKKFALPYKPLLDAGVTFYASLGNHDNTNERFYKPFNMNGESYYSYKKGNVHFFVLNSNYMDPKQAAWLENAVTRCRQWGSGKSAIFIIRSIPQGKFHGPAIDLRQVLEPLFIKYGVDVVFAGHDHVYERVHPQHGIYYFTEGASGELRPLNLAPSAITDQGFDRDRSFMQVEIAGDDMYFETNSAHWPHSRLRCDPSNHSVTSL